MPGVLPLARRRKATIILQRDRSRRRVRGVRHLSLERRSPAETHLLACPRSYVRLVKAYQDACAMDAMPEQIARQPPPSALPCSSPSPNRRLLTSRNRISAYTRLFQTRLLPRSQRLRTRRPARVRSDTRKHGRAPCFPPLTESSSLSAAARPSSLPPVRNTCVGIAPSVRCSKRAISSSSRALDEASPPMHLFAFKSSHPQIPAGTLPARSIP